MHKIHIHREATNKLGTFNVRMLTIYWNQYVGLKCHELSSVTGASTTARGIEIFLLISPQNIFRKLLILSNNVV